MKIACQIIGLSSLLLINFELLAGEIYAPAEYKPKVEYLTSNNASAPLEQVSKQDPVSAASASEKTPAPPAAEDTIVTISSTDAAPELSPSGSSSAVYLALILLSAAAGLYLFLGRRRLKNVGGNSVPEPHSSTGVEKYLGRLEARKTGVEKYLERQAGISTVTGVSKYLAKQALKSRT